MVNKPGVCPHPSSLDTMVIDRIEFDMRNLSLNSPSLSVFWGRSSTGIKPMALHILKLLRMSRALYLEVILMEKQSFLLLPKRW